MQIKMAENNARMRITVDNTSNNKTNANFRSPFVNTKSKDAFGANCKVTISKEGRKKSEQSKQPAARSIIESQTERLLLREQEQVERFQMEQSNLIDEISKMARSLQNSYNAGADEETIQKQQDALNRMRDLKKRQEEENEQRVKDAMNGVSGSSKEQQEIDRKNEELLMLIKILEEQEDEEGGTAGTEGGSEADSEEQDSAGAQIQESASKLGVSAARRELETKAVIDELRDDGYANLAKAREMMSDVNAELQSAEEAAHKENLSDDEREQLVSHHTKMAYDLMVANYEEMSDLRRKGLQEIQDARDLDLKHIDINPLGGVQKAQQTILDAGAQAALQGAASDVLDKASQELEDRVQAALDKRNDITEDSDKKTEEEEIREEKLEEIVEKEEEEEKNSILDELIV